MGTSSWIAMETNSGFYVDRIYCHFDGYVKSVGYTLLQYYNDPKSVKDLIKHGDIRALRQDLSQCEKLQINKSSKMLFTDFVKATEGNGINGIEYFYLYTQNRWHYCKAYEGNILAQELQFNYNKEKLLEETKQYALEKFENNQAFSLDTNSAKLLNYVWELAYINKDEAYELFEKEMINLKLSSEEIEEALQSLEVEIDEDLGGEYLTRIITQEIFRLYLEGERSSCLIGTFDKKIDNLVQKYFFSYTEKLNFDEETTLDEFVKEKQIDLLEAYFEK